MVELLYEIMLQVSSVEMEVFPKQGLSGYEETCINIHRYEDTGFNCFVGEWEIRNGEKIYIDSFNYSASTQEVIDLMETVQDQPSGMLRYIGISTEWEE